MRLEIVGAGAMGMLLAAALVESGAEVVLITRSREQAEAIRSNGLQWTRSLDGAELSAAQPGTATSTVYPKAVYAFEELQEKELQATQADGLLLTVKQTSITEAFAGWIGRRLRNGVPLVCYQNGIGHTDVLARYVPMSGLLAAVTTEGALRHSPRHVEHTGHGTTWIGQLESENVDGTSILFQKKLQIQLKQAGFDVSLSNQITSKVWNKLLINAVINPLTAVLQVTNGTLPELPAALPLMRSLYEEGASLAEALRIPIAPDLWEQLLAVCRLTANNRSSMLQDVQSRRRTELDAITGGLLKKADEAGMQLHAHKTVYALVRSIEQQWQ